MANRNLSAAKKAKQDEYYTQMNDIQAEINAYLDYDENTLKATVTFEVRRCVVCATSLMSL